MPVPEPEEVMELAAELKEARSRVIHLESRWASFFSPSSPTTQSPATEIRVPGVVYLKPRIVAFLESRPDVAYTTATVAKALDAKENSVGPYLSDLAVAGKVERRGRGLYGALRPSASNPEHELTS
jgi:hypothetical protein